MRRFLAILFCMLLPFSVQAQSLVEPSYDPSEPRAMTPWYGVVTPAQKAADMAYIKHMRPHHAGALSMSEEYLANPDASNTLMQQLAKGIIHNQTFEIEMLDRAEAYLKATDENEGLQRIASTGLAQQKTFYRAPVPGPFDAWAGDDTTSAADVKFAKAMIVHHEGALIMCDQYIANPDVKNGYLKRMCLDILKDQAIEIAFMIKQMSKYPGDIDAIKFDPSMVHGMDDMMHHMGHHHH